MKLSKLTKGVVAFSVLSMLASGALVASAATTEAGSTTAAAGNSYGRQFNQDRGAKFATLTDAQKAEMEANRTAMETKFAAVKTALSAGDYNAWVTAQTAINEDCPLLTKITVDNFSQYVQAYNLRTQADTIMQDLGVDGPGLGDFGFGMMGAGHGRHFQK